MQIIEALGDIAASFDVIVFDQWGVLHDGTRPYDSVPEAVAGLAQTTRLAVLSNSGKRADLNAARIGDKGYDPALFDIIMTSGEALFLDMQQGHLPPWREVLAITAAQGDAEAWAKGLDLAITKDPVEAEAVLLMGLREDGDTTAEDALLATALERDLPLICSNPDKASPRAGGRQVRAPGALATDYAEKGGQVMFYGKPHRPIFNALSRALNVPENRILMVGDSLEHDIAGGHGAGWKTAFIQGGLYAQHFADSDTKDTVTQLAQKIGAPLPDYTLSFVR